MADLNISGDIQISPTSLTGSLHPTTIKLSGDLDTGNGKDGYSPTVDVEVITGGHRITITDRDGAHTFDVVDGTVGVGISDISKTSSHDAEDTYTITYTDGSTTTFVVTNGEVTWNDVGNIAVVSHTQPSSSHNVIWIEDEGTTIELPTMEEFEEVADDVSDLKAEINQLQNGKADIIISNASGTVASFTDGAEYDAVGLVAEFAPYQEGSGDASPINVRPIHGWTGLDVVDSGKNIFDGEVVNANLVCTVGEPIRYNSTTSYRSSKNRIPIPEGVTDIFLYTKTFEGTIASNRPYLRFTDKDDLYISNGTAHGYYVTIPDGAKFFRISTTSTIYNDNAPYYISTEKITQADVVPIITTHISWQTEAGEVFGGYVDVVRGKLVAEWKISTITALGFKYNSTWNGRFYASVSGIKTTGNKFTADVYCSIYKSMASGVSTADLAIARYNDEIYIKDSRYSDTNSFITANGDIPIVYPLSTPIEYDIAPATIELLKGYNNVWSSAGGNVDVTYRADTKLYIDGKQLDIRNTIAPIEDGATASQAYAIGKFFYRNGSFCKAKTAIASGAAFTLGTNYEVTTVAAELFTALS